MKISTRRMDKTTVLDISGDIDMAHSTELRRVVLVEFRESRTPRVVLNMIEVRYIDSSGVASLVEGLKASRDVGSRLILVGLSPIRAGNIATHEAVDDFRDLRHRREGPGILSLREERATLPRRL